MSVKRVRFAERYPDTYSARLGIALQIECEPNNECFHDHYYIGEDELKQLPSAVQKFQVERKSNSGTKAVSNGGNARH